MTPAVTTILVIPMGKRSRIVTMEITPMKRMGITKMGVTRTRAIRTRAIRTRAERRRPMRTMVTAKRMAAI